MFGKLILLLEIGGFSVACFVLGVNHKKCLRLENCSSEIIIVYHDTVCSWLNNISCHRYLFVEAGMLSPCPGEARALCQLCLVAVVDLGWFNNS